MQTTNGRLGRRSITPRSAGLLARFTRNIYDNRDPHSLVSQLRARRFELFIALLQTVPHGDAPLRVLDVGGTESYWHNHFPLLEQADLPCQITVINIPPVNERAICNGKVRFVAGDARDLSCYADRSFDAVFSNSVIEHVGTFADQMRMAAEIQRVGKTIYVQTPNRAFPIEPHFRFAFWEYIPKTLRARLLTHFSLGWRGKTPCYYEALAQVDQVRLMTKGELAYLFKGATIVPETFYGLTKSYMVISTKPQPGSVFTY